MTSKRKATAAKQRPANSCSLSLSLAFHMIQNKKGSVKWHKTTTATAVEERKEGFGPQNHRRKFATLFDHGPCPDHCNGFREITDEYDWTNRSLVIFGNLFHFIGTKSLSSKVIWVVVPFCDLRFCCDCYIWDLT